MDAGFVPALPFHHGYLEPDCVERRGAYARNKNTSARLCAKNAGGAYARGYLRDTTVYMSDFPPELGLRKLQRVITAAPSYHYSPE